MSANPSRPAPPGPRPDTSRAAVDRMLACLPFADNEEAWAHIRATVRALLDERDALEAHAEAEQTPRIRAEEARDDEDSIVHAMTTMKMLLEDKAKCHAEMDALPGADAPLHVLATADQRYHYLRGRLEQIDNTIALISAALASPTRPEGR